MVLLFLNEFFYFGDFYGWLIGILFDLITEFPHSWSLIDYKQLSWAFEHTFLDGILHNGG